MCGGQMELNLIRVQAIAARLGCEQMTEAALRRLSAGEADGAALEMEAHLRVLHYTWRLARPG
jgi:hypothetical protein